jgi:hypothetical protein
MMTLLKIQSTVVFFSVVVLITVLASSAVLAANRVEIGSRVTLASSDPFHGKVLSRRDACARDRAVAVYLVKPGPDGLYDTTRSNALGEWSLPAGMPNGDFYAVARVRSIDKGTTTLVCNKAVSHAVTF